MLEVLKKLLERDAPQTAAAIAGGLPVKAKPLIKMEYRVWRHAEQRWEDAKPVDSIEVIIS